MAAHEFGHSLGLSHSDVEGSLMYPWYQNFDYDLQLSQDDMLGIKRIYGESIKCLWEKLLLLFCSSNNENNTHVP